MSNIRCDMTIGHVWVFAGENMPDGWLCQCGTVPFGSDAKKEDKIPEALFEETMDIAGIEVRVYVLDDERRVVHAEDVEKLFAFIVKDEGE